MKSGSATTGLKAEKKNPGVKQELRDEDKSSSLRPDMV
jgi:hypothetical protein